MIKLIKEKLEKKKLKQINLKKCYFTKDKVSH